MASSSRRSGSAGGHRVALGAALLALSLACSGGGGGGTAYSLQVSTASLVFAAERNAPIPAAQTLTATFRGDGLLAGYPPGISQPGWLSVDVVSSTASSATLSVRVNTTSLSAGTYRTTLRLVTGKQDGSAVVYKDVAVQYTVTAGLAASATSLAFTGFDGTAPAQKSITLTSDVLPKDWTLAVEPAGSGATDWLVLSATSGTLATATTDVQVGAAVRPPGSYSASLVLRDGTGSVRSRISASYQVAPAFALGGTLTTRVTEAATSASLDLPLLLDSKLDAASGATHLWQATSTADWLSVIPATGDLAADASLTVRLDPAKLWALANGTYSGTITVATTQGGVTTASVPVSLTVALAPKLGAPASASYTVGVAAAPADLTRTVTVTSNLGDAFASHGGWTASSSAAWVQPTPSSGAGGGDVTLDLVPAALAGLANGAQTANVTVQAADARVAGATVKANLALALPDVAHVAPYTTWVGRSPDVIVRGSGFGSGGTLPVLFGSQAVTGTVVSDTELRVTAPTQAAAARVPVSIENSLGLARATSELVVLPAPTYAAYSATLTTSPTRMTLDPERQAVLLSGAGDEVRRFKFASGAWSQDAFQAPAVTGGYVTADGKTLLVTSGNTGTPSAVFYEVDPATFAIRKQTGYPTSYARYDLAASFNDGRILFLDSEQWVDTLWYPDLTRGVYFDAHSPKMLLTRDRSRVLLYDDRYKLTTYDVVDTASKVQNVTQTLFGADKWTVSGDGSRVVLGSSVYDRNFNFLGAVSLQGDRGTPTVALSPDGTTLYTLARNATDTAFVFRRTDLGTTPYTADATALSFTIGAGESPVAMAVSEDGSTLFLLTRGPTGTAGTFRAFPLP
ncbi:BACON domain-containing protein [Anaeromyxobacter terrae]|uniref:BACON domain-containing protein n=1 Tax=Anaeromyxobacter terrae TaxID=2925406 RepID=UPI001F5A2FEF|nr:IPT/TIG domain-containing protein [Anaeromyxobacter sp. SG22]